MIGGTTLAPVPMTRATAAVAAAVILFAGLPVQSQRPDAVPFEAGETLDYRVKVPLIGTVGRAVFRVEGPVHYRGEEVLVLRSDVTTKWGPIKGSSATTSWFDPERLISLRFVKDEQQPGYRDEENVALYPDDRRFEQASGVAGEMPTDAPLDELSFIYFLRTMELQEDSTFRFVRHYDAARNPIVVRLIKRETVKTARGEEPALLVEMRVRHPRHYRGEGVIRIHLSDDEWRIPLKIESNAPATGKVTLVLESVTPGTAGARLGND